MNMHLKISQRGELAPHSPIRKLVPFANQTKQKGINIFHLNIGQPDFHIPPKIRSEIIKHSSLDYLPYANSQGVDSLLRAWQKFYQDINISINTSDIVITYGASEALIFAFATVCDPKDELVVFEPFYANYNGFANLISAKIKSIPLAASNGYHLPDKADIIKQINSKTKAICLINPNNPTGTVFTRKELRTVLDIAIEHNLFLIADETYYGICFDHNKSESILNIAKKNEKQHIIIVDSVSKRLNMCGARVGALISLNPDIISTVMRFAQERLAVATLDQQIISSQMKNSLPYINKLAAEYQKRRDALISTLTQELKVKIHIPEGAFYIMLKLPFSDADNFAKWLLTDFSYQNETVMVAPGSGFYNSPDLGHDEIRLAYVLKPSDLKKAARLLARAIIEYQKNIGG